MTGKKIDKESQEFIETVDRKSFSVFKLERMYEDLSSAFKPSKVTSASDVNVLITVDTNVLLLPYTIRKDGLPTLQRFYKKLKSENRLYLPARAAREFINNRDKKLAELLKAINDIRSRINIGETKLSPILDGLEGSEQLTAANKALSKAKEDYTKAIDALEDKIRSWSGDDPVTAVYATVFDENNIISPPETLGDMLKEWDERLNNQLPPGYKDASKDDTGIGDFLIWKSILFLGKKCNKDLIFITGEEKADWFVRVNGGGAYPRPELIAEYRINSGGRNIKIANLHDVLREMEISKDFVSEVERAEIAASSTYQILNSKTTMPARPFGEPKTLASAVSLLGRVAEYTTPYGGGDISFSNDQDQFLINISEQSADSLWVYPNNDIKIFHLANARLGEFIRSSDLSQIGTVISVSKGEAIYAVNSNKSILVARLISANTPRSNEEFNVVFSYNIYKLGIPPFVV